MNPENIPGMVEHVEQELLSRIGQFLKVDVDEVMLEFGAFFGRSTRSIVNGILRNRNIELSSRSKPVLRVYDRFSSANEGNFVDYVKSFAGHGGVQDLLKEQDGKVNFRAVFDHYMLDVPEKVLDVYENELYEMTHDGLAIKFMHIDLPKRWGEYQCLIDTFFLHLRKGAILVYQDFFFHWSATLATAVFLWIEGGLFEPVRTAASSLVVKTKKEIIEDDVRNLEAQMGSVDCVEVLHRCRDYFSKFDVDRRDYFVNRLLLAQLQHSFEKRDFKIARSIFRVLIEKKIINVNGIYVDLLDLLGCGFSL